MLPPLAKVLLAEYDGTWDEFIGMCEDMAREIATTHTYGADSDGLRMKFLVAIEGELHTANDQISGGTPSGEKEGQG